MEFLQSDGMANH